MQKSLGQYLFHYRKEKNISLLSLSHKLKVRASVLEKIENNQPVDMPILVFKSCLINYGKIVGADTNTILEKFYQLYPHFQDKKPVELPQAHSPNQNFFISVALGLSLLAITGLALYKLKLSLYGRTIPSLTRSKTEQKPINMSALREVLSPRSLKATDSEN